VNKVHVPECEYLTNILSKLFSDLKKNTDA